MANYEYLDDKEKYILTADNGRKFHKFISKYVKSKLVI